MRGETLTLTIASAAVGCATAVGYHLVASRMHLLLAMRPGRLLPLLSVASMVLRLLMVGLVVLIVRLWTPFDPIVTSLAFIGLFTVLTGFSLYRMAVGTSGWEASIDPKR